MGRQANLFSLPYRWAQEPLALHTRPLLGLTVPANRYQKEHKQMHIIVIWSLVQLVLLSVSLVGISYLRKVTGCQSRFFFKLSYLFLHKEVSSHRFFCFVCLPWHRRITVLPEKKPHKYGNPHWLPWSSEFGLHFYMFLWFVEVSEPWSLQLVLLSGFHIKSKWKDTTLWIK